MVLASHQHTNTPTHQHTNTPTHQHTNTPTHQHTKLSYKPLAFALLTMLGVCSTSSHATGFFTGLGDLPSGLPTTIPNALSTDGIVVVGYGYNAGAFEAFRWSQDGGMMSLGDLAGGGFESAALAVNADGSVVVGYSRSANGVEAFRWTQAGGMVGLGDLAGGDFESYAGGVSADGNVVVGSGIRSNGREAFRWTQAGGMVGLGDLAGGSFESAAFAANADGTVVVGLGMSGNGQEAFRWTQAGGMVGLGYLAGSTFSSASAVNADGSVVVGYATSNGVVDEAFSWTQVGGMVGLGYLAGGSFQSRANAVNADGTVVVGTSDSANGQEAFRWTQASGMISVQDWLNTAGVSLAGFAVLNNATSVSADGNTVVGHGRNANGNTDEAFIARVDNTTSGIVGLTDLGNSMAQTLAVSSQMEGLSSLIMNGGHHRPLMEMAVADKNGCAWVNGDAGRVYRSANGYIGLTEFGVCHDFSEQGIRIGGGLGHSFSNLTLANNGNSRIQGQYGLAEIDWQVPNQPVLLSLLGVYGKWDANLRRGYAIAGTQPSSGETDVSVYSLRARLDWQDAFYLGAVSFSPRVAYTLTRSEVDGYQEEGGSAPANFQDQNHTAKELRLGLTGKYTLNDKATLLGHGEFAHRFDERGATILGNINALGFGIGFKQAGNPVRQDWVRLGAEVNYKLTDTSMINASSFISSAGQDADITAAVSYHLAF